MFRKGTQGRTESRIRTLDQNGTYVSNRMEGGGGITKWFRDLLREPHEFYHPTDCQSIPDFYVRALVLPFLRYSCNYD